MKDEFTSAMHADMLGWSQEDAKILDIYVYINRGFPKEEACKQAGIDVDYYDNNIEQAKKRCFNT